MVQRDIRDRISCFCWDEKHHRCVGWMVVPDHGQTVLTGEGKAIRCECPACDHPPVAPDRHRLTEVDT